MKYTEIKTIEQVFELQKDKMDLAAIKEALSTLPKEYADGALNLICLQAAVEVINNDDPKKPKWEADYNNSNQKKWFPWYVGGDSSGSGFRFDGSYYVWTTTVATGGARLALKDEARADHMNKYFQDFYKGLWLILR